MTEVVIDLTNYKDRVGSRVEPGTYTVIVDDAELDKSRNGNPMVNLFLRVVGGEFDGATLTDRLVLTEKSLFRVVGFMQALGMKAPRKRFKVNLRQFIGKTLDVEVDDGEPYNGRIKSEVRGYLKASKSGGSADTDLDSVTADEGDSVAAGDPEPAAGEAEEPAEEPKAEGKGQKAPAESEEPEEVDLETLDL